MTPPIRLLRVADHTFVDERAKATLPARRVRGATPAFLAQLFVGLAIQVRERSEHDVLPTTRLLRMPLDMLARDTQIGHA